MKRVLFEHLQLIPPLARAVAEAGYEEPTPIQAQAIPHLLAGRDVLGCAQTGTGKTAAFALPVLQHLARTIAEDADALDQSAAQDTRGSERRRGRRGKRAGRRPIRALVLSPTRELVAQIGENFEAYGKHLPLRHLVIFGGVNAHSQIQALSRGVDVLLATPGRLLDLEGQGYIDLSQVEFFVLDEADRMLDMGFIHDIRKVLARLPEQKQNLLFSATMPPHIVKLASEFLHEPVSVEVSVESSTAETVSQQVMFVERADKRRLLAQLLSQEEVDQSIVFTRTKHGANRLVQQLERAGLSAAAIHGNKSQNARTRALTAFRDGTLPTLVATDIAARGIDVPGVSHVFNFDLPNEPESYVHRIGRTGRAGVEGHAIAFCDPTEGAYLRQIERLIEQEIEVVSDHEWHCAEAVPPPLRAQRGRREAPQGSSGGKSSRNRRGRGGRGRGDRPRAESASREDRADRRDRGDRAERPERSERRDRGDRASQRDRSAARPSAEGGGEQRRRPRRRRRRGGSSSSSSPDQSQ